MQQRKDMISSVGIFFNRYFSEIFIILFVVLGILGVQHHEMWRDELQAWMIAQASYSIPELYQNLRYESHPPLWYWLLSFLQRFTSNPESMQYLHLLIASTSAWLVLKHAPFSKLQRVLLVFGYYLFYEYALISRSYALGVLFIFLTCIYLRSSNRNYFFLGLLLILMSLTSIMTLIVAVAFVLYLIFDFYKNSSTQRKSLVYFVLTVVAVSLVIMISLKLMTPPHEGSFSKGMITGDGPIMFLSNIANAYSPDKFIVIQSEGFKACLYIFSLIFFISSLLFFIKNRTVNVLYLSGVFMFAVFFSIVYAPCARHMGHLFILLIACWWIGPKISALASRLITALLIIQFLLGWSAYIVDWKGIFSNGQRTAQYIQQHHLEDLPIIAGGYESATVAGYLQKPVFYAMQARWGTFLSYNNQYFTLEQIFDYLKVLSRLYQKDVLLILPNALDFSSLSINDAKASILKEESFVDDIGVGEKYYLYIYKYKEEA